MVWRPSPNFNERRCYEGKEGTFKNRPSVSILVIHYTQMETAYSACKRLCDAESQVSAHYLISKHGALTHMVEESHRAWHAGVSFWRRITDVNSASIGIELDNKGDEPFPRQQRDCLYKLCHDILGRHKIEPWNVVGHCDIAPLRKVDPGPFFPWEEMVEKGIGLWPKPLGTNVDVKALDNKVQALKKALLFIGYEGFNIETVTAFQSHYCPNNITGKADAITLACAYGLVEQIKALQNEASF